MGALEKTIGWGVHPMLPTIRNPGRPNKTTELEYSHVKALYINVEWAHKNLFLPAQVRIFFFTHLYRNRNQYIFLDSVV